MLLPAPSSLRFVPLARRLAGADLETGDDVWLGGWDRRSESILVIASASESSAVGTELGVKGLRAGEREGDFPSDDDLGSEPAPPGTGTEGAMVGWDGDVDERLEG
jgi:hypothetical protein